MSSNAPQMPDDSTRHAQAQVLVVDDSAALRAMLGDMLDALRIPYVEARHGAEGLDQLEQHGPFDILLVDWHMPQIDGLEFVERVRSRPEWHEVSIAMVTSENNVDRVSEALQAGADDYLMKPFDREMLVAKLNVLGLHDAPGND